MVYYLTTAPGLSANEKHMYGHDLQKVNRNAEAVIQFQKAQQIEELITAKSTLT
jgi:hypothetical protein